MQRVLGQPFDVPGWMYAAFRSRYAWFIALAAVALIAVVAVLAVTLRSSGPETQTDTASAVASSVEQPSQVTSPGFAANSSGTNGSQVVGPQVRSGSSSSAALALQAKGNGITKPVPAEISEAQIRVPWAIKRYRPVLSNDPFFGFRSEISNPDVSNPEVFALLNNEDCQGRCRGHMNALPNLKMFLEHTFNGDSGSIWRGKNADKFVEDPALVDTTRAFLHRVYNPALSFPPFLIPEKVHQWVEPGEVITVEFYLLKGERVNGTATMVWRQQILQWKILDLALSEAN